MKATKHTLPNGVRVITVPHPDSIATNILVLVEAGSKYEDKQTSGLSHFLEHMCFKGTKRRPRVLDIASDFDSLGARYNAFTGREYTGYYATVQPKFADRALDILADLYLNPTFPRNEIEKEKGVIIEEIKMYEDTPIRHVQDLFIKLLYDDQPAGWDIAGTRESVRRLSRADFLHYRREHYVSSSTIVVVSGRFNEEKMVKRVANAFNTLNTGEKMKKTAVTEAQNQPRVLVKTKASDQGHLVLGFRTFAVTHESHYALEILATILGGGMSSRLFRRVREQMGAAYYVHAMQEDFTDHGFLQIAVGTDPQRASAVVEAILDECRKLTVRAVPLTELRRTQDLLAGNLYLGLEKVSSVSTYYGLQQVLTGELISPQTVVRRLSAVTPREVRQLAHQIFTNRRLNLAVIGPFADESVFAPVLRL